MQAEYGQINRSRENIDDLMDAHTYILYKRKHCDTLPSTIILVQKENTHYALRFQIKYICLDCGEIKAQLPEVNSDADLRSYLK